jgi:hypothetical protein
LARHTDAVRPLRRRYFQTRAGVAVSGLACVCYLYLLTNTLRELDVSRSWIRGSWLDAPLTLATQRALVIHAVLSVRGFKGLGGRALGTQDEEHLGRAGS